jgi:hypothetical protein
MKTQGYAYTITGPDGKTTIPLPPPTESVPVTVQWVRTPGVESIPIRGLTVEEIHALPASSDPDDEEEKP